MSSNLYEGSIPPAIFHDNQVFSHTISVIVDNEAGVLARVVGLFSGRGYNIESLTVSEIDKNSQLSRINLVTSGTTQIIEQIKAQLGRIVPVHSVIDLTSKGPSVSRELALVRVDVKSEFIEDLFKISRIFTCKIVGSEKNSYVFEIIGKTARINAFIELVSQIGSCEISRTGIVAISISRDREDK